MEYFTKIIKHYFILALSKAGVSIDSDTHTELDDACKDLEKHIDRIVSESMKTHLRVHHRGRE